MNELVEWRFPGGGWLQVYKGIDRAGNGSCTLSVASLSDEIARLRNIGIEVGRTIESTTARVIMIKDPDRNSIAFAEALDGSVAQ